MDELWAELGKVSSDVTVLESRLVQLRQRYQEIFQSIQTKNKQEPPSPEEPKTSQ